MLPLCQIVKFGFMALFVVATLSVHADATERRVLAGYYPSWSHENALQLKDVPSAYTHVLVAFAKPDFAWNGKSWVGTGLQFEESPAIVKTHIAALKARGTKVILAVGGATYLNWTPLTGEAHHPDKHTKALARFIRDMGFDGLDVDYETEGISKKQIEEYRRAILALSNAAGTDRILALAAWSTGADCTKATGMAPCGSKPGTLDGYTGRERVVFADNKLSSKLSMVNVMTYDAGVDEFDPVKAWSLYRALLPETVIVNIGFEISPEDWGPARLVATNARATCSGSQVKGDQFGNSVNKPYSVERSLVEGPLSSTRNPLDGAMLWHILKDQKLPTCGHSAVVSPRELELTARTLLDQ